MALTFVDSFVVRTVQPVIRISPRTSGGRSRAGGRSLADIPEGHLAGLAPVALASITLAYRRAVGEFGSVVYLRQPSLQGNHSSVDQPEARTI